MRKNKIFKWLAPLSLLLLIFISSFPYISLWFHSDDMPLIHTAATKSVLSMLFDRETNIIFHKFFYMPLFPIPFKIDWHLFKLNPAGYHIHNLIIVFLTSLTAYKALTLYIPSLNAWIGAYLFALSYPNITNIGWIVRKQYLWGTLLVLLSFYLFKKFEEFKNYTLYAISLLLYLCALLFKEAFAPMPAAIFILSSGNFKSRFLKSLPFFLALCIYFLLRFYFIGGFGGYIYIQTAVFSIAGILKQSLFDILYVISVIWRVKWLFLSIITIFLLINAKRAWIFLLLFLIWASPLLLLKVEPNDWSQFYYPSKFTIPVLIVSSMIAFASTKGTRHFHKFLIYALIGIIFFLQISNLYRARDYLLQGSEDYKKVSYELKEKIRDNNVFIVHTPWFFTHYYELLKLSTDELKGRLTATNQPVTPVLEPYLRSSRFVYMNGEWHDTLKQPLDIKISSDGSPPPEIDLKITPPFFEGRIIENKPNEYVGALLYSLSGSNIQCTTMPVPASGNVKMGIVKDKEEVFVYRKNGDAFSRPFVIRMPD